MKMAINIIVISMIALKVSFSDEMIKNGKPTGIESQYTGEYVDITPWTYTWRSDLKTQKQPEAYFIPRRLERIDKVYRTAFYSLPPEELKSIFYNLEDLLKPLLPKPEGTLLVGQLWTGGLVDYNISLEWPKNKPAPSPDTIELRVYPTSFGWFGWTVDKILKDPSISDNNRIWTFKSDPNEFMDSSYNARVPAATEMIAIFSKEKNTPIPKIKISGPSIGKWKKIDIEIECGFASKTNNQEIAGEIEPYISKILDISPLNDESTSVISKTKWKSTLDNEVRKGIKASLLYAPDSRPGLDSRITIKLKKSGFTFSVKDLDKGPILVSEYDFFITKAGSRITASNFTNDLSKKNMKSIRQMTREHREAESLNEIMQEVRLWTCPDGTDFPPFNKVDDPFMKVELPDERWTDAWRSAYYQLRGKHMWGGLAFEVGRVAHEMDMIGLHDEADKVYQHFLESPGVKSDGDYSDGTGSLEWATTMRHDMGYSHDGTHASTGRLLFAMSEKYFLTGDKNWFIKNRARLQAAADWIIRQRRTYMNHIPNQKDLFVAGLMPPAMLGDYAIPSCDWHWYYVENAFSLQALQRFSDALMDFDKEAGIKYYNEAKAFRNDLLKVIKKEALLSPVRLGRDGMYHSYVPRMAYARGLTGPELGAPQFPDTDLFMGALPLAEPFSAIEPNNQLMIDTLDFMEELGTSEKTVKENEELRKSKGLAYKDTWFWNCFAVLPKASHNANIFLYQDDIQNFLRSWANSYASVVGSDGKLWEHWHLGNYDECSAPDNGTAGWFMENFRNLLVMEENQSLWITRAAPRVWFEQSKSIKVGDAPTHFGNLVYEISSDTDNNKISAKIKIPDRNTIKSIKLRLRHPENKPIARVTVNGNNWRKFDIKNEVIILSGFTGNIDVVAYYK